MTSFKLASILNAAFATYEHKSWPSILVGSGIFFLLVFIAVWVFEAFSRRSSPKAKWADAFSMPALTAALISSILLLGNAFVRAGIQDRADGLANILATGYSVVSVQSGDIVVSDTVNASKAAILFGHATRMPAVTREIRLSPAEAILADSVVRAATGGRLALTVPTIIKTH